MEKNYQFDRNPQELFLAALRKQVLKNIAHGHQFNLDLTQNQFDVIVKEQSLDSSQAIDWLFDSGLYVIDDNHEGWFCPTIRQEIFDKHNERQF